ncbi:alpha/beta fold hydrolase [Candidatus Woesearchaeota archaeon]|nr:alpha/beta fold hydrolase [Candidatus Woesearchaeota archaeon]
MPEQKSFWKRYEFIIIAIVTLLFIYIVVVTNQKINFFLGNELIVYLMPNQQSFSMHYGELSKAKFDVSIDNVAYCKALCSYSFNDRSTNEVIDKGDFEIQKEQHFTKEYDLSVKRLGSGQDIYSFDASCRSIRSFLCLTKSPEKSRSSLITVNYDLTETEKELKKILKQNVTKLLELLSDVDVLHQQLNQKYFELSFKVNLKNLTKGKIDADDLYDKTRISIENLRSLWSVENYIELNQLFNESLFETSYSIKKFIGDLGKKIDDVVALHNGLLFKLKILSEDLNDLSNFVDLLGDNGMSNNLIYVADNFNKISSSMANNTFENYDEIAEGIDNITKQQNSIKEKTEISSTELFFSLEYHLKYENDLLCSLKQDCNENISILNGIKNTERVIEDYPKSVDLMQNCDSLTGLNNKYSIIRNEASIIIADKNISFPSDNYFLELAGNFKDNEIRKINNSYFDAFENIKLENKTNLEVIKIADEILPKSKAELIQLDYNQSVNLSLYLLSKIKPSDKASQLIDKCQKIEKPSIANFNFEPISANITYKIFSKIDTILSDNPPICCVFNECKPCCRDDSCKNDPKTFPIIFLHGHSLAKGNSPEFSLDSFNKLQSKLQDDGYLNSGIVSLYSKNEPLQQGIWGLSGKPVTVKASYYYDAFRKEDKYIVVPTKSENIDTYALRIRDLIEIVKQRTNKPKVNIIAHSMGGLVARRYMQIFGDDDIDKLVMLATPNNGIAGAISDYCGLIGENRECRDMHENSLFINKLNDPLKQPAKVKLYAIIGQGCQMKFGNGDGIVLTENAKLKDASLYFVNGTCGGLFGGSLHTEILNIEQYPETYSIIKGILRE